MYKSKRIMYQKSNLHSDFCMDDISRFTLFNPFNRAKINMHKDRQSLMLTLKPFRRNMSMGYLSNLAISASKKVFNRGYKDVKNMACISSFEEIGEFQDEWEYEDYED